MAQTNTRKIIKQNGKVQTETATASNDACNFSQTVRTSGNQTIAGVKTFSSIPVLPSSNPTTNNQAVRKQYVDDGLSTKEGAIPAGETSQYWRGDKTWQTFPSIPNVGALAPLYFIDIVLDKTVINNINSSPFVITTSDFGLAAGEAVKLLPDKMELFCDHDGVPLVHSGNLILNIDAFAPVSIPHTFYVNFENILLSGFNFNSPTPLIHDNWFITATSNITGGGTNATIKIRLYYEKVTI